MANVHQSEASHPAMDMEAHRQTWHGFMRFVKVTSSFVIVLLILMAIFLVH